MPDPGQMSVSERIAPPKSGKDAQSKTKRALSILPMNILLNGKDHELADEANVAVLLETQGLTGKRLAVEINEEILPRSRYEQHRLQEGDRVEIVRAIGGG
ncbi:MAG: thiamine biosynthesis protein ThiS [Candidatus Kentron sp. G]|nr:MAG: thiamine biosynthesis protein ThiS [Candidatus Kentron sp. G]VFN01215.1 MAG: thiamine biosynthesis protein ThiS [Candidatus Kentron sp. G]VFN02127.1 MAG: thiamine biosynthesis protein ThiS [Candidatus Kentron sp. G]